MRLFLLLLAAIAAALPAAAKTECGAKTYLRYGETRAKFGDVLGACRPGGYCSVVSTRPAPPNLAVYSAQMRIARPSAGAPFQLEFTGVVPMPRAAGTPMSLTVNGTTTDLTAAQAPTSPGTNEFRVSDQAVTDALVTTLTKAKTAKWVYEGETGPATAKFGVHGLPKAIAWIDCMGTK
jgi:hypothetical protein